MILLESCLQLTAKILVEWVVFADVTGVLYAFGHVVCDMPAPLVGVSPWCRLSMVVGFTSSCWIHYCYISVGNAVKWWIVG
jgi:hypothetical protein